MLKKPLNKIRLDFLESVFPENLLYFKKLNIKAKRSLKSSNPRGFTNRIKRVENRIIKRSKESGRDTQSNAAWKGRDPRLFLIKIPSEARSTPLRLAKEINLRKRVTRLKYAFSLQQLFASFYNKGNDSKKGSRFKSLLKERKKLSLIYGGLSEKQIQKLALQAKGFDGLFDENFVKILEKRLDVALFRICFFPTIFSAKQWINHKHILVNNSVVTKPGFQLSSGDIITLAPDQKIRLKKKISFFVAEKIKIRSRHYYGGLNWFYKLVKSFCSILSYNKNLSLSLLHKIVYRGGFPKNNKIGLSLISNKFHPDPKSFLRLKNLFTTARSLTQRVKSLRISSMKPLNLEVCYKNMVAVVLFSPQKVSVPTSVNLHAIQP